MSLSGATYRTIRLCVLAAALIVGIAYPLVLALDGSLLVNISSGAHGGVISVHNARPWLILAAIAAVLILLDRAQAERRLATLAGDRSQARREVEEAQARQREAEAERERARRELGSERERAHHELDAERGQREQLLRAWRSEREWNRELRTQIVRMQRARGVLGRHDDVREMVLELTMELVEAEKGILISRRHEAGGQLEVVCSLGFENDPADSALAQHFASRVIKRDETTRQDDAAQLSAEGRTAADEEVENLLAIPIYLLDEFSGVIVCANREGGFGGLDDDVLLAVGDHAGMVLQNSRLHGDLRNAYLSTIALLADAIELKDPELRGHSDAVSEYVLAVADRLEFEPQRREALIFASLLHDVGKLGISERILLKPAALTPEERAVIQLHPRIGYQLVCRIPALQDIAPAVLHHHERFDGQGYPGGLTGDAIPLEARIISIADTFSAITSDRPYSPARSVEEACAELERCAGGQFDPHVVALFVEEVRRHPPDGHGAEPLASEPEFEPHRVDGDFKLGARSFGITDSLTMLYSHRHFHETARSEAQRAQLQDKPFAVVIAQLQDLPEINRSRGFAAGDSALQAVGAAFQRAAGRCQGRAFRVSGRRIGLIAPGLDEAGAEALTASLVDDLRLEGDLGFSPLVSLGVSAWRPGDEAEPVVERAVTAAAAAPAVS